MQQKYDLKKILEEIALDEKILESRPHYWASQKDIKKLVEEMKKKKQQ